MVIIIDNYGVNIDKENRGFKLWSHDVTRNVSPYRVTAFHILKPCSISSSAILLAAEHDIPILFFDRYGKPTARLWQSRFDSHAEIRQQQLVF